jgi:hypothetical protein
VTSDREVDEEWLAQTLRLLPLRDSPLYSDLSELPTENDSSQLVRFLAQKYDEGNAVLVAMV